MENYGATSAKPIDVCSDVPEVELLAAGMPTKKLETLASKGKNGSVNGKSSALTASQAYPPKFGKRVASVYRTIQKRRAVSEKLPKWSSALGLASGGA